MSPMLREHLEDILRKPQVLVKPFTPETDVVAAPFPWEPATPPPKAEPSGFRAKAGIVPLVLPVEVESTRPTLALESFRPETRAPYFNPRGRGA